MTNKKVIYTAIFGGKDDLIEPKFIPKECDFVCFTDQDFESNIWDIRKVESIFEDPVRSAKIYKVLPHKYLSEYEISIWIDGNILVRNDLNKLINKYLNKFNLAVFDHNQHKRRRKKLFWMKDENECRNCIYKEATALLESDKKGKFKDNPDLIKVQVEKYKKIGYPKNNGLLVAMIILRKHNEQDIIRTMKDWWEEIKNHSRRDQLSFNYVAWKNELNFIYMKGDSRRNKYFLHKKHKIRKSNF